jgi:hypothetical protein
MENKMVNGVCFFSSFSLSPSDVYLHTHQQNADINTYTHRQYIYMQRDI